MPVSNRASTGNPVANWHFVWTSWTWIGMCIYELMKYIDKTHKRKCRVFVNCECSLVIITMQNKVHQLSQCINMIEFAFDVIMRLPCRLLLVMQKKLFFVCFVFKLICLLKKIYYKIYLIM